MYGDVNRTTSTKLVHFLRDMLEEVSKQDSMGQIMAGANLLRREERT